MYLGNSVVPRPILSGFGYDRNCTAAAVRMNERASYACADCALMYINSLLFSVLLLLLPYVTTVTLVP